MSSLFLILTPVKYSASGILGVIRETLLISFSLIILIALLSINLVPSFATITGSNIIFLTLICFKD